MVPINEIFRSEVAKQKVLLKLRNRDIAKMTGFSESAIRHFMCGDPCGERLVQAIAQSLKIER